MDIHKLNKNNYKIKSWIEKYPNYEVNMDNLKIHSSWDEFKQTKEFKECIARLNKYFSYCLNLTKGKVNIFPYPDLVFNALNITPLDKIKVVILGQDPYFNSDIVDDKIVPQAMGLSFSVPKGIDVPPSLVNIYNNLIKFKHIDKKPSHGNLAFWAYQGCLLLNTSLTVQEKCPNGHEDKWKTLTDLLIQFISDNTENVVFMFWGGPALKKKPIIDENKHKILISSHPSPMSFQNKLREYDSFMNTDHFGEANKYLSEHGKSTILWQFI